MKVTALAPTTATSTTATRTQVPKAQESSDHQMGSISLPISNTLLICVYPFRYLWLCHGPGYICIYDRDHMNVDLSMQLSILPSVAFTTFLQQGRKWHCLPLSDEEMWLKAGTSLLTGKAWECSNLSGSHVGVGTPCRRSPFSPQDARLILMPRDIWPLLGCPSWSRPLATRCLLLAIRPMPVKATTATRPTTTTTTTPATTTAMLL